MLAWIICAIKYDDKFNTMRLIPLAYGSELADRTFIFSSVVAMRVSPGALEENATTIYCHLLAFIPPTKDVDTLGGEHWEESVDTH